MHRFLDQLDEFAAIDAVARVWWRDDDAIEPSPALDRLLLLTGRNDIPLTLAVIPAYTGDTLAIRLREQPDVTIAVHGWSHQNYAGPREKKQELGTHRPEDVVMRELSRGLKHLKELHGVQAVPVLVPPWNRISDSLVARLPGAGFAALSVFGQERPARLPIINTHVDVMDWHCIRGGRDQDSVFDDLAAALQRGAAVGLLTHHLVHDEAAWNILETLVNLTKDHPGWRWISLPQLLAESPSTPR